LDNGIGQSAKPPSTLLGSTIEFWRRQQRDWKVTVLRTSLDRFAYQILFPYLSIYIMALGASGAQLGLVNSIGMVVAGVCSPFTGWIIDRIGPRKIYLFGIAVTAVAYLCYGVAQSWELTTLAMMCYWLGYTTSIHSCATICGNCLVNQDRATGMLICETVAAGMLGVAGPMIGTWLVTLFGGATTDGIRPLFLAAVVVTIGTFAIVATQLSESACTAASHRTPHLLKDLSHVLRGRRNLKKWIVISSISQLPLGMVLPYTQVFAYSVKGASEWTLGAMVTGSALTSIVFAIPFGRLADRIGRRKVLFCTIPLFWASNLLLIVAPSPAVLLAAGVLQGFYFIGSPIASAMERELVPPEQMGRWLGINRFFKMVLSAGMALVAGVVWDEVGPQYIFVIFVGIDLLVRMPLLIRLEETLHQKHRSGAAA
jgi:MFS family permease